jgi:colanic acid/amylovoran biosynthesis glycosyltransferase
MAKVLSIIPSVPVWTDGDTLIFDRKFYDGMLVYKHEWPGEMRCVMYKSASTLPAFGTVSKLPSEVPYDVIILGKNENLAHQHIKNSSVVLAAGDAFQQLHVSELCKKNNIKCVYIIEYIPETRRQILNLDAINPIVKLRRHIFLWRTERQRIKAFQLADGLQSNGPAAHNEYKWHANNLLYFDTRVNSNLIIDDNALHERLSTLPNKRPLQIAFSGRLIRMKGADQLIALAQILHKRRIEFHMTIYGSGDLEQQMMNDINQSELGLIVKMAGAVDFYSQLLPEIKANIDLYVILHKQSDPSCTYLETLSCGIPIVGYNNKAFSGLLEIADIGWGKSMNDIEGIANVIEQLDKSRNEIKQKSTNAVNFARLHDFEATFKKRIGQLVEMTK